MSSNSEHEKNLDKTASFEVVNISKDNDEYKVTLHQEITSAELIFLIRYLKNEALPNLIRKEID